MNQLICLECGKSHITVKSLSNHIRHVHSMTSKKYYDKHYGIGNCKVCDSPTRFKNLSLGYEKTCCHSCGAKLFRENLKNSPDKFNSFIEKVKINQKRIWSERSNEEREKISNKISQTLTEYMDSLTVEERKKKQGWLNRLTEDEKVEFIENVMKKTGMYAWHKNASVNQLSDLYIKRTSSLIQVCKETLTESRKNPKNKELYYEAVKRITALNYGKFKNEIDPYNLRGNGYHLDHKFSIIRGFIEGIDPEIIGSKENLEIITDSENCIKSAKCSIDKDLLIELYHNGKL